MARRRYDDWHHDYFPPSRPREAVGGIKAQSQRGAFGESWWAKRWIQVLEGFNIGARLQRGRSYARRGQVLDIAIDAGVVKAKVQGSRAAPYRVEIALPTLSDEAWESVLNVLREQAIFAAKLLNGEMPGDIEQVFAAAGVSLFPARGNDLDTDCSCPDWSNPCKHIAATYYLLGEEFDRDPFLLFRLRGMPRETLMKQLAIGGGPARPDGAQDTLAPATETAPPMPLELDPDAFWHGGSLDDALLGDAHLPATNAALARGLGGFPFWRAHQPFRTFLEDVYAAAAAKGRDHFIKPLEDTPHDA